MEFDQINKNIRILNYKEFFNILKMHIYGACFINFVTVNSFKLLTFTLHFFKLI